MAAPMDCLESLEGEDSAEPRASGVEVALPSDPAAAAPLCPHGPTLLFVKVSPGKEATRRFYACSACRDRKDCNFFQWEDEKLSEARLAAREIHNQRCQPPLSRAQCIERAEGYLSFIQLPLTQRKFCRRCQQLLLPADWREHGEHQLMAGISIAQLGRPSQLLFPLENKKTHAQYLFTDRSCQFLAGLLATLGFRRVLCVGAPRLHEQIRFSAPGEKSTMRSLLLDIDFRFEPGPQSLYSQFYLEESFCRYNMFNHHFFDGEAALEMTATKNCPFSGFSPIFLNHGFVSFSRASACWITSHFHGRVDYDNHALYKHGKTGRKQSPVRIFTNIPPNKIILPSEEGYRLAAAEQGICLPSMGLALVVFLRAFVFENVLDLQHSESEGRQEVEPLLSLQKVCEAFPGSIVPPATAVRSPTIPVRGLKMAALFVGRWITNAAVVPTSALLGELTK
ncbi:rRNA N6-adenosine-methyltransferase ZCCHC4 [Apodemus speciosus]|uniref:rRNA N6-adenosine-methyltransferase ZCCHC4 n=1 Tax=Apodemus speciosus TaxID=105296 RepID=A0ABQ0ES10_APOSI